jgi:hypothetical protein
MLIDRLVFYIAKIQVIIVAFSSTINIPSIVTKTKRLFS